MAVTESSVFHVFPNFKAEKLSIQLEISFCKFQYFWKNLKKNMSYIYGSQSSLDLKVAAAFNLWKKELQPSQKSYN